MINLNKDNEENDNNRHSPFIVHCIWYVRNYYWTDGEAKPEKTKKHTLNTNVLEMLEEDQK
jgi:hypothetical protein